MEQRDLAICRPEIDAGKSFIVVATKTAAAVSAYSAHSTFSEVLEIG